MKKDQKTPGRRIDRYLYRNSYFYKWGKKTWKNRWSRSAVILIVLGFAGWQGARWLELVRVKNFVLRWQRYENHGDFFRFSACLDMSRENPDRNLFPDWQQDFFRTDLHLEFRELQVFRQAGHLFKVRMQVRFIRNGREENRFRGSVYLRRRNGLKIFRVEM